MRRYTLVEARERTATGTRGFIFLSSRACFLLCSTRITKAPVVQDMARCPFSRKRMNRLPGQEYIEVVKRWPLVDVLLYMFLKS